MRRVLGADRVLEVRRLNLVDGVAVRPGHGVVPGGAGRAACRSRTSSATTFHDLLDVELGGATQTISAGAVAAADAEVLGVPGGLAGAGRASG